MPLSDSPAFGGAAADAFHLVIPSLPGYGSSRKPSETGWEIERIAWDWSVLMLSLDYDRYVAQGGDWGSAVTVQVGTQHLTGLAGIHLNMLSLLPSESRDALGPDERRSVDDYKYYGEVESAYARLQGARPQTTGCLLSDSLLAQTAWIYEKLRDWSNCEGEPETILSRDEILDNIMLYWPPNTGGLAARLYRESFADFVPIRVELTVGASLFPKEIVSAPRSWADRVFPNIVHWNALPKSGHFSAFEQPESFVDELPTCCRAMC